MRKFDTNKYETLFFWIRLKYRSLCYHYIRKPDDEVHFPRILGTKISDFEDQIKKFKTKFDFLNLDDIYNMYYSKKEIRPRKPGLLLTFDDGLSDHFEAAKILYENNIQATFFIPTCILRDQLPANPNIIHYCIAQFGVSEFLKIFYNGIDKYGPSFKKYPIEFDKSIDDPWEIIKKIKFLFKYSLTIHDSRNILLFIYKNLLEKKYPDILKNMHLKSSQVEKMIKMNHNIGTHTHNHISIGSSSLTRDDIEKEIIFPKKYFKEQFKIDAYSFSYPYGEPEDILTTRDVLGHTYEYKIGFTVEEKINDENTSPLDIGRYQPMSKDSSQKIIERLESM